MGFDRSDYAGKPVIAIINTWSDINPCHTHFRQRAEEVKRGVWQAGGFPVEMPAISLSEPFQKPTTMLYRNLLAMETEELLRSYPADGAVLMGGCDKTTPALVMGAISIEPAVRSSCRPGRCCAATGDGKTLGSAPTSGSTGPSCAPATSPRTTGRTSRTASRARPAHCMTMGTASTMTQRRRGAGPRRCPAPRRSRPPIRATRRWPRHRQAHRRHGLGGPQAADILDRGVASTTRSPPCWRSAARPTRSSHLIAMARRAGVALDLERFDALARRTPVLANLRPVRQVPDGGLLLRRRPARLPGAARRPARRSPAAPSTAARSARTSTAPKVFNDDVIRRCDKPLVGRRRPRRAARQPGARRRRHQAGGDGAAPAAGTPGRAVVFEDYNDMAARIDDPTLEVDAGQRAGAAERRPAGRARACRSGAAADPEEAAASRACATWCASPTRA